MLCRAVKILFASKVELNCKVKGCCVPKVTIETLYLLCRRLYRVGQFWEAVSVADKFTVLHKSAVRRKAARETDSSMKAVTVLICVCL